MPVTVFLSSGPPCQVDDFSADAERSVKGALYLRPNALATITRDELEHIQRDYPLLAPRLRVVREVAVETVHPTVATPATVEEPPDVIALPPAEEASSEPESEELSTRGRGRSRKRRDDSD